MLEVNDDQEYEVQKDLGLAAPAVDRIVAVLHCGCLGEKVVS
jgi:hypothetical protein